MNSASTGALSSPRGACLLMMPNIVWFILVTGVAAAQTVPALASADCDGANSGRSDCRENMDASFFTGVAVDTFAAAEDWRYLNRGAAAGKHERAFAGFQFGYRLAGRVQSGRQLWVYGETVHGVRSAEVSCDASAESLTCGDPATIGTLVPNPTRDALLIIRNASTLEGALGLRFEFVRLHVGEGSPAVIYAKAQAGFLKVAAAPDDAADVHQAALGVLSTQGIFRGSYIEAGWGRNDLFPSRARDRWKVDGRLVRRLGKTAMSFFARMVIDSDLGAGSDAIQSYIGFDFDLRRFSRSGK